MTPLNQRQAAAYLNMSVNTFKARVRPHVRRVDLGAKFLFRVQDLDLWLDTNAR